MSVFSAVCQRDDAEGDEVRPITFDPVTRDADPLTTSALCAPAVESPGMETDSYRNLH